MHEKILKQRLTTMKKKMQETYTVGCVNKATLLVLTPANTTVIYALNNSCVHEDDIFGRAIASV